MNGFLLVAISLIGIQAQSDAATAVTPCEEGYWGATGQPGCNLCGKCNDGKCDPTTGKCDPAICIAGWSGPECNEPVCADGMCGPPDGGKCVAPDQCVCTKLYSQEYEIDEAGVKTRKGCYSLRTSGLKGAGISLLVLIVSILACKSGYKFSQP